MFEHVNFSPGEIIWETPGPGLYTKPGERRNSFDLIKWYLREDMAYISYPEDYAIYVGWARRDADEWWEFVEQVDQQKLFPSEKDILFLGEFHITIIKKEEGWTDQNKIFYSCVLFDDLDSLMKIAVSRVKLLLKG